MRLREYSLQAPKHVLPVFLGKTLTDLNKHVTVRFVLAKDLGSRINRRSFKHAEELTDGLYEVTYTKQRLVFDLPIIFGVRVCKNHSTTGLHRCFTEHLF